MTIAQQHKDRKLYHFTNINNLDSILKSGGLLSTNLKNRQGIAHHNVALNSIQSRRNKMEVTAGPKGVVHDYVPFYFARTNTMLLNVVCRKIVDQEDCIYFLISAEKLKEPNVIFTDMAANTLKSPNFYDDPKDLDQLNWDVIDSLRWKEKKDEDKHAKMAEALVYEKVPLDWIEKCIVFDEAAEERVKNTYQNNGLQAPPIYCDSREDGNISYYFRKFFLEEPRNKETLVHGPVRLKKECDRVIAAIMKKRRNPNILYQSETLDELLQKIEDDFCYLPELAGIQGLETSNEMHKDNVEEHTKDVARQLEIDGGRPYSYYSLLKKRQKTLVKLAAYFHDIGKGPANKWSNGIQSTYADHPYDSVGMLEGILTREVRYLKSDEIRILCILTAYHDIIGDIISKDILRDKEELKKLGLNKEQLRMLAALSIADISTINKNWAYDVKKNIRELIMGTTGDNK